MNQESQKLDTKCPHLAAEWHLIKNFPKHPSDFFSQSNKKVWWLGKCGHEWEAKVANRSNGRGCPFCCSPPRQLLKGFNDLQTKNPELAKEWHPTKNGTLTPVDVFPNLNKTVWWLGKCGHEWQTSPNTRSSNGAACPYCVGRLVLVGYNDIQTKNPTIGREWNYKKNGPLFPASFSVNSSKKVWWICEKGHEWESTIDNRSSKKKSGCSFCCSSHTKLEKFIEEKLGIEKFDKPHLINSKINYRPDYKLSETIFLNSDGLFWHREDSKGRCYHAEMRESYESEGKRILQFYEDEVYNKWPIVESIINNSLGKITNKVQARKCELKEVTPKESSQFFEVNHLMGSHKASKSIGLYFNNELVSTLSYRAIKSKNKIEIARFGSKINTIVIGAFGKLLNKLKEIAKENGINQIESFCDLRYATGSSYEKLGFFVQKETLGWCWTDRKSRYNRLMCKAGNGNTERENAQKRGWFRIYDAGQRKYLLK